MSCSPPCARAPRRSGRSSARAGNRTVEPVLVPIDGSENAERALRLGVELARRNGVDIDIVLITDLGTESIQERLYRADEVAVAVIP